MFLPSCLLSYLSMLISTKHKFISAHLVSTTSDIPISLLLSFKTDWVVLYWSETESSKGFFLPWECHWLIVGLIQSSTLYCDLSCVALSTSNQRLTQTCPPWPCTSQTGQDTCGVRGLISQQPTLGKKCSAHKLINSTESQLMPLCVT